MRNYQGATVLNNNYKTNKRLLIKYEDFYYHKTNDLFLTVDIYILIFAFESL